MYYLLAFPWKMYALLDLEFCYCDYILLPVVVKTLMLFTMKRRDQGLAEFPHDIRYVPRERTEEYASQAQTYQPLLQLNNGLCNV